MPYTMPSVIMLDTLLGHLKAQAVGSRQAKLAETVLAEYHSLVRYTQALTELLNQEEAGAAVVPAQQAERARELAARSDALIDCQGDHIRVFDWDTKLWLPLPAGAPIHPDADETFDSDRTPLLAHSID